MESKICIKCQLPKRNGARPVPKISLCDCHIWKKNKNFSKIYYTDPEFEQLSRKTCDYLTRKIRQHKAWLVRKKCPVYQEKRKNHHANWRKIPGNIERVRVISQRKTEKDVTMLRDTYVVGVLTYDCPMLKKDVTPELIELKRKQLKLYRNVKSKKTSFNRDNNSNNNSDNC